jgi:hypothetical protein
MKPGFLNRDARPSAAAPRRAAPQPVQQGNTTLLQDGIARRFTTPWAYDLDFCKPPVGGLHQAAGAEAARVHSQAVCTALLNMPLMVQAWCRQLARGEHRH